MVRSWTLEGIAWWLKFYFAFNIKENMRWPIFALPLFSRCWLVAFFSNQNSYMLQTVRKHSKTNILAESIVLKIWGWGIVRNLNCNLKLYYPRYTIVWKEKLKFKDKTWAHNLLSDLFLPSRDFIPKGTPPRTGSEKSTGLAVRRAGSDPSSSTKQLGGLWLPLPAVSGEIGRGAVLGIFDLGSGLSST